MVKVIGRINLPKKHYWVGNISGIVSANTKKCPLLKPPDRLKYVGWTTDIQWPLVMNTGRMLHKEKPGTKKKRRKKRKNLENKLSIKEPS